MVDVFGGVRRNVGTQGPRGPVGRTGPSGKPGIDSMSVWMSKTVLQNFQEKDETGCFFI